MADTSKTHPGYSPDGYYYPVIHNFRSKKNLYVTNKSAAIKHIGYPDALVGFPAQGTHAGSEWQSYNGIDFWAKPGKVGQKVTLITPVTKGTIKNVGWKKWKDWGGYRFYLYGDNGSVWYYQHTRPICKHGQRVRPGDILGAIWNNGSGSHLHLAARAGGRTGKTSSHNSCPTFKVF